MNKRLVFVTLIVLAVLGLIFFFPRWYTDRVVANARARGEFTSPEAGMLALTARDYTRDYKATIHYAGPNEDDRSMPYVWFVIVEIRASARADGSQLHRNGCDSGGTYFVQLKDGKWVQIPEGFFMLFVPSWLEKYGFAGEGQATASTTWATNQAPDFCQ